MLRFVLFFAAVMVLTPFLARLPLLGALFGIPFVGFWFTAILLSVGMAKLGSKAIDHGARRKLERSLGAVDTPHHKGKLGALLLAQGRAKKAIPLFEAAVAGDPSSLEWRHRLGMARLQGKADPNTALAAFDSVLGDDMEFGFGSTMLLSAQAAKAAGYPDNALERVRRFEVAQGPSTESTLLRAELHKIKGDRAASAAALDELPGLLKLASKRDASRSWAVRWRALILRLFP